MECLSQEPPSLAPSLFILSPPSSTVLDLKEWVTIQPIRDVLRTALVKTGHRQTNVCTPFSRNQWSLNLEASFFLTLSLPKGSTPKRQSRESGGFGKLGLIRSLSNPCRKIRLELLDLGFTCYGDSTSPICFRFCLITVHRPPELGGEVPHGIFHSSKHPDQRTTQISQKACFILSCDIGL